MNNTASAAFIPVLTVMADYGNAPFLWLIDSPERGGIGSNLCDGSFWDESFPMSEGLWRKFADWAVEFDHTAFYSDAFNVDDWDWPAFHARGLQLSVWLKEEVGNSYRVIYEKSADDPNHHFEKRMEILAEGMLLRLPPY